MRVSGSLIVSLVFIPLTTFLLFALLALFLITRHTDTPAHTPWQGPSGTRWEGVEARGMQHWEGYFSKVSLTGEYLELRCVRRPYLKTRTRAFWPGAAWNGALKWEANEMVYLSPQKRYGQDARLTAPWWLKWCPAS